MELCLVGIRVWGGLIDPLKQTGMGKQIDDLEAEQPES